MAGCCLGQLRACISSRKQYAERELGMSPGFGSHKVCPYWLTSSVGATSPKPTQTAPQTGDLFQKCYIMPVWKPATRCGTLESLPTTIQWFTIFCLWKKWKNEWFHFLKENILTLKRGWGWNFPLWKKKSLKILKTQIYKKSIDNNTLNCPERAGVWVDVSVS